MKALIFGMQGQDGTYLSRLLEREGVKVVMGVIDDYGQHVARIQTCDYVFHLAASSTTSHSKAIDNHSVIAGGTLYILETVRSLGLNCPVFVAGSALQYDDPPKSVYACAREYARKLCKFYRHSMGLKTYFGTLYHHESPLRKQSHVSRMVADAAREGRKIEIGDLSVVKEWTYAGDIAEAIWMMVNQDAITDCEICSGEGYSIQDWCHACYGAAGLNWKEYVTEQEDFSPEYSRMVGFPEAIKSIGWEPKVGFQELAAMMVNRKDKPA